MRRVHFVATILGAALAAVACQGGSAPDATGAGPAAVEAGDLPLPVPRPIAGGDFFPDLPHHRAGIIHQFFPVPPGAPFYGDGILAEPNGMTDFNGFVAQVFQGGTATDSAGNQYVVDADVRVYVGEYVGTNGQHAVGTFCEL